MAVRFHTFSTIVGAVLLAGLMAVPFWAQPDPGATPTSSMQLAGADLHAQLLTSIDTNHATVGQPVSAKLVAAVKSGGQTVLPKDSVLSGTITKMTPATKTSGASVSVTFTSATTPDGQKITVHAGIAGFLAQDIGTGDLSSSMPAHLQVQSNSVSGSGTITKDSGNFTLKRGEVLDIRNAENVG